MEQLSAHSFVDVERLSQSQDPLKKIIASIFLTQQIDASKVHSLLTPLKEKALSDECAYQKGLYTLLCVAIFTVMSESVKEEVFEDLKRMFNRFRQKGLWENLALESLIAQILQVEIETSVSTPKPLSPFARAEAAIYQLFSYYLNRTSYEPFCECVADLYHYFDSDDLPFFGLQQTEMTFKRSESLATFTLFFFLASLIGGGEMVERRAAGLFAHLQKEPFDLIPAHLILIYLYFDLKFDGVQTPFECGLSSPYSKEGVLIGSEGPFSYAFTQRGVGTGLGAIHQKNIKILSFGPQSSPIGAMENYGIWHPSAAMAYSASGAQLHFSGWTKLIEADRSQPEPSLFWVNQKVDVGQGRIKLKIEFQPDSPTRMLAFFVKAEKMKIEQKTLLPLTLDRFHGQSDKIVFEGGGESLSLRSRTPFQAIPLAGGDHFWSADFLVVYELDSSSNIINLEIS